MKKTILSLGALSLVAAAQAVTINVGAEGCCTTGDNVWPGPEGPQFTIDGVGQKYLNFGKLNTGVVVTLSSPALASSMQLWSANDAEERDPSSYLIFGTDAAIPAGSFDSSLFTFVGGGSVDLPATRNLGAANPLLPGNSDTVNFSNPALYTSYLIIFPTVKDFDVNGPISANSMQIAEIQLFDGALPLLSPGDTIIGVQAESALIPEPSTGLLALLGASALLRRRRK